MADIILIQGCPLAEYISEAIYMKAFEVVIEYKDGYEEIIVVTNQMGFSIARLNSNGEEATKIREQLYELHENKGLIEIVENRYELKVEIYEDFGEDAFKILINQV